MDHRSQISLLLFVCRRGVAEEELGCLDGHPRDGGHVDSAFHRYPDNAGFIDVAYPGGIAVATILKSPGAGIQKAYLLLGGALTLVMARGLRLPRRMTADEREIIRGAVSGLLSDLDDETGKAGAI